MDRQAEKTESRRGPSWNRLFHRIGGLFASLLLLWIAGTGIGMQLLDMKAILTHEPPTDPQELSMKEGQYGPANFAVIQVSDFSAPALPQDFDLNKGIVTVLQAVHAQQNGSAGSVYRDSDGGGNGPSAAGVERRQGGGPGRPSDAHSSGGSGSESGSHHGRGPAGLNGPENTQTHSVGNGSRNGGGPGGAADSGSSGRQGKGSGPAGPGGGQGGDAAYSPLSWIELRMTNGIPTGQALVGTKLVAFNALTGQSVTPIPPVNLPQGRGLPPSLRQKLKTLHRFWDRSDTPGVYFEFLFGIILWALIISGLIMYFRLLGVRARQGRSNLFWIKGGGGWWRGLHRVISVVAAVFLLWMSFTGTWIGFESSVGPVKRLFAPKPIVFQRTAVQAAASVLQRQPKTQAGNEGQNPQAPQRGQLGGSGERPPQSGSRPGGGGGGGGMRNPLDFILPLRDDEVRQMMAVTLNSMQQLHSKLPIKAVRLRTFGQTKQGVVITGGDDTNQYVFNADSGQPASLSEQGYPEVSFPFGTQVHENIKHLHSGAYFGIPARLMNLFAGFCLTFLSISGLVMYFIMWRNRRKAGRKGLIWA
jgi:uncharacterized iron-regulated membrane protein